MQENKTAVLVAASPLATSYMRELFENLHVDVDYSTDYHNAIELLSENSYELIVLSLRFDGFTMFEVLKQIRRSARNSSTKVLCLRAAPSPVATTCDRSTKMALRVLGANYFWDMSLWQLESPMYSEQRDFMVAELQALFPQAKGAKPLLLSKFVRTVTRIEDLHDKFSQVS